MTKKVGLIVAFCVVVTILVITLSVTLQPNKNGNHEENNNNDSLRGGSVEKIVGGENVLDRTAYPYFVFLQGDAACAGSLVAPDMVLTAAQCLAIVDLGDSVTVNAYYSTEFDKSGHIKIPIAETITHPLYEFPYYDFALLRLSSSIEGIEPVSINIDGDKPATGDEVTVIGLGNLAEEGGSPEILQEASVRVIANQACQENYSADINDNIMICAGMTGGGRDACNGDAGGPLLDSEGVQVGIVSAGNGCARPRFPGIYARISAVSDWIVDSICMNSKAEEIPDFCFDDVETSSPTANATNATIFDESGFVALTASPAPTVEGDVQFGGFAGFSETESPAPMETAPPS